MSDVHGPPGTTVKQPWWQGPILLTDAETTGVDVVNDRVVQWCTVDDWSSAGLSRRIDEEIINPGVPIAPEATQKHRITDEHAQRFGNAPKDSLRRWVNILSQAVVGGRPIGGMNLSFDLSMLRFECQRHLTFDVEAAASRPLAPVLDLYVLDKYVDPYRKGYRKLIDLARHYDVEHDEAKLHDAVEDTIVTGRILRTLGEHYSEVGNMGLYALHMYQVDWAREQRLSLQRYFRTKKGQPDAVVDPCWPYCADPDHPR
jgi:DNA polymerase-3 subunit epsilon